MATVLLFVCFVLYTVLCTSGIIQWAYSVWQSQTHSHSGQPAGLTFFRSHILDLPSNFPRRPKHQPRKRGKRGGTLARLRRRGHRLALPSLIISNVCSLANKKDKRTSLILSQRDFRDCAAICLTETWLHTNIPDSALQQEGFTFHRADHTSDSLEQPSVGIYINQNWCTDTKTLIVQLFAWSGASEGKLPTQTRPSWCLVTSTTSPYRKLSPDTSLRFTSPPGWTKH